jgi:membrane associated rhomboid family serine protease
MSSPHNESPVNPLPPVVVALFLVMAGVEVAFELGSRGLIGGPGAVGWRIAAIERYAFSGQILDWMLATGQFPPEHVMRLVTYPFIHGSFTHAMIGSVMLLALGKMVGEVFGALATLAIFVLSSVGGAVAYGLILDTQVPLFGAFPPVYGLIGAFTYLLWVRLGQMGAQQVRAFSLIGMLLGLQLIFGLLFGSTNDWVADLGGFGVGLGLSLFLVPGGWRKLLSLVRRD